MKNDHAETLSWLLAAEEHPHLREEPEYLKAEAQLEKSQTLQQWFVRHKSFLARHPVLVQIEGLPADSRARIEKTLREELKSGQKVIPIPQKIWGVRRQFAWAAALALLLAGMSVISSMIIQQNESRQRRLVTAKDLSPEEAFYHYAGGLVEKRLPLQYRDNGSNQLVAWLEEKGADSFEAPEALMTKETMGCAYLDGPHGKISLICFDTDSGTVHLFVTDVASLQLQGTREPERMTVNQRPAIKWHDEKNAYLLISHDKGQELPEVFL